MKTIKLAAVAFILSSCNFQTPVVSKSDSTKIVTVVDSTIKNAVSPVVDTTKSAPITKDSTKTKK